VTKKLEIKETPLPQDLAEGVDEDEWVSSFLITVQSTPIYRGAIMVVIIW